MRQICATILFTATLLLWGCTSGAPAPEKAGAAVGIERVVERGPVMVTTHVDRSEAKVAEPFHVAVTIQFEQGVKVTAPPMGDRLGEWVVRNVEVTSKDADAGGSGSKALSFEVLALKPGTYEMPSLEFPFVDRRQSAAASANDNSGGLASTIATDPIELTVVSSLRADADPQAFRDVKPPVEVPLPRDLGWFVRAGLAVVSVAAIVAGMVLLVRRWRRRVIRGRVLPPHRWALQQLDELRAERLPEQGRIEEFYVRLNSIVRVYIELRFGLRAPERTTEEFLVDARASDFLSARHKVALSSFLEACDLVKFALYQPKREEIEEIEITARRFVEETMPQHGPTATPHPAEAAV